MRNSRILLILGHIYLICMIGTESEAFSFNKNKAFQIRHNHINKYIQSERFARATTLSQRKDIKVYISEQEMVECNKLGTYGGDYAGHSATYNKVTGDLIPVPDYMVPESMIEWGAVPGCLEVITSEIISRDSADLDRFTVSVMPEVGCGVDNLDTTKKKSTFSFKDDLLSSMFDKEYKISSFHHSVVLK